MQHSVIPPSGAAQWVYCAGWPTLAHAVPNDYKGEAAEEGTASHWIFPQIVQVIKTGNSPSQRAKLHDKLIGSPAENGVIITEEMWEGAEVMADHIGEVMMKHRCWDVHIEERVDASAYVHPQSFGTTDCWLYTKKDNILYIIDYKYGHGLVEAFENWQGINYFAGIIDELIKSGVSTSPMKVVITIIQPRARHPEGIIRHWETSAVDLQPYVKQLSDAAHAALSHYAECKTGSHCKKCVARARCSALGNAAGDALDYVGYPVPNELDGHALGLELDMLKRAADTIKYRMSALEQQAVALAEQGEYVRGYGLVNYYGNKTWMDKDTALVEADALGIDLRKQGIMTPAQAVKKGMDKNTVEKMTHKPHRGKRLERLTETDARRIFGRKGE